mgnify:CR=1 FL=1
MSLYIEYDEIQPSIAYNLTLPDEYNLIGILNTEDLPKGWNSKSFTIKDLLEQSDDYQSKIINKISKFLGSSKFDDYAEMADLNSEQIYYEMIDYDCWIDEDGGKE